MSKFYASHDNIQQTVKLEGGFIVCLGPEGYFHCPSEGDVLDLLEGTDGATRAQLLSFVRDFQSLFLDLDEEDDSPILYATNVADYLGR